MNPNLPATPKGFVARSRRAENGTDLITKITLLTVFALTIFGLIVAIAYVGLPALLEVR